MYLITVLIMFVLFAHARLSDTDHLAFTQVPAVVVIGQPTTLKWVGGDDELVSKFDIRIYKRLSLRRAPSKRCNSLLPFTWQAADLNQHLLSLAMRREGLSSGTPRVFHLEHRGSFIWNTEGLSSGTPKVLLLQTITRWRSLKTSNLLSILHLVSMPWPLYG